MLEGTRKPWLAVVLTLICPGLGHLYCGRIVACLAFFLASLVMVPAAVAAVLAPPSGLVFTVFLVSAAGMLVLAPWALVDAWRSARRAPPGFEPREFQRPAVYAMFVAAGLLCPLSSATVLRGRFLHAYRIASDSMSPALRKGDLVFTNGVRYSVRDVRRGDIVTFREPGGDRTFVKRVVGVPGDQVEIRDGVVFVNGESVAGPAPATPSGEGGVRTSPEPERGTGLGAGPGPSGMPLFKLSPREVYVLGDAIAASKDSRHFGPVPVTDIEGPVEYRYWSRDGLRGIGPVESDE